MKGGSMLGPVPRTLLFLSAFLSSLLAPPAEAQQAGDPDWPCVQILVPVLAPQAMWAGPPLDEVEGQWSTDSDVAPLVHELASPSTSLEEVPARIASLAQALPEAERQKKLALLFEGLLEAINGARQDVIAGIKRYARRQHELARSIAAQTRAIEGTEDPAKAAELANARDWDLRVFNDRQRALTQVCDQPVLLEQRAFALARVIQNEIESH
jgi:hypothetical protein